MICVVKKSMMNISETLYERHKEKGVKCKKPSKFEGKQLENPRLYFQ